MTDAHKGAAALFLAAVLDTGLALGIRELQAMFSDAGQYAARLLLLTASVVLLGLLLRRSLTLPRQAAGRAVILGLTSAATVVLFVVAINATKVANAFFLCYGGSILASVLLGRLLFAERPSRSQWAAVAVSLAGLSAYADVLTVLSVGAVAGVLSGVADAMANSARRSLAGFDRWGVLLYSYAAGAAIGLLLVTQMTGPVVREVSWWPTTVLVLLVVVGIGMSQLLLYGFAHTPLGAGTIILASELFFAAIAGWLLYSEVLSLREAVGGLLVFIAAVLSAVDVPAAIRRRRPAVSPARLQAADS